eukprot:Pgem_evm1s8061
MSHGNEPLLVKSLFDALNLQSDSDQFENPVRIISLKKRGLLQSCLFIALVASLDGIGVLLNALRYYLFSLEMESKPTYATTYREYFHARKVGTFVRVKLTSFTDEELGLLAIAKAIPCKPLYTWMSKNWLETLDRPSTLVTCNK